jgi:hypothetical protein
MISWRRVLYSVGVLVGLVLFLYQVWLAYTNLRHQPLTEFAWPWLMGGLGCYLVGYWVQMLAWATGLRYLGAALPLSVVQEGYFLSFLPRYIPGTVWGYWSRGEWLAGRGVSHGTSALASLLEVTTLLLTAFILVLLHWVGDWWPGVVLISPLALGVNWWLVPRLASRLSPTKWALPAQTEPFFRSAVLGSALYLAFWLIHGSALWAVAQGLGAGTSVDLWTSVASASLAWAIGFLVLFVPTGLGVREASLAALLTRYTGVAATVASSAAVVSRLAIIGAELVWLLVGLGLYLRSRIQNQIRSAPYAKSNGSLP